MKFTILGSSASLPTRERNGPGGLLVSRSERLIIECGEGTTRQLSMIGQSLQKISAIWLSHSHIDHFIGVANFVRCLDLVAPKACIPIFGNDETLSRVELVLGLCRLRSVKAELHTIQEGVFRETDSLVYRAFCTAHTVPTFGLVVEEKPTRKFDAKYADELGVPPGPLRAKLVAGDSVCLPDGRQVQPSEVLSPPRKGRKFVYVPDTGNFENLAAICKEANLLVCECTYSSQHTDLANEYKHMTAKDVASLAREACVEKVVLTHISPREDSEELLKEAVSIFKHAVIGEDFASFELTSQ